MTVTLRSCMKMMSAFALTAVAGGVCAQQYLVTPLPPAAGFTSPPLGTAINASGEVTGTFYGVPGTTLEPHLFTFSAGTTTDLGTGDPAALCTSTLTGAGGSGINSNGAIAATLCSTTENPIPAVYQGGAFKPITVGPTVIGGVTTAINNNGLVVGTIEFPSSASCPGNTYHAFRYASGTDKFSDLQPALKSLGCSSQALAINGTGEIVGSIYDTKGEFHAFLYAKGTAIDIGSFPCDSGPPQAQANGINASGDVTGFALGCSGGYVAFLYANGMMEDIGNLGGTNGSEGNAINSSGQITGWSYDVGNMEHAFVYSNGSLLDLNAQISSADAALYTLVNGLAINDVGQIVAQGYANTDGSQTVTFLLTPASAAAWHVTLSSRSIDGSGNYVVNVLIENTGGAPAANASLTAASLVVSTVATKSSSTLPVALGSLAPGVSVNATLGFPGSAGAPHAHASLRWTVKDTAGVTHGSLGLTLP